MEFPNLGKHCSYPVCNQLDFLPVQCDACKKNFCLDHMRYEKHGCVEGALRDCQVPVCPLCNKPVVSPRGERPDVAVGTHIDNDCQSGTADLRRKVFVNKCSMKGCKRKEIVAMKCKDCGSNYCIIHRHAADHKCADIKSPRRESNSNTKRSITTVTSLRPCHINDIQGSMDEDEALAHAIALSLAESDMDNTSTLNQNMSSHTQRPTTHTGSQGIANSCCLS